MSNETLKSRIAAIKARVDIISEMKRRGIALRACGGSRLEGLCPFHEDATPSLSVYVESQQFHCFVSSVVRSIYPRRNHVSRVRVLEGVNEYVLATSFVRSPDTWRHMVRASESGETFT